MSWIELFLNYARSGLDQKVDLEFILPHAGEERAAIMAEVDAIAQYHYKLKLAHEEKVRRRFQSSEGQTDEEAALVGSVLISLNLDQAALGGAGDIADEEDDETDEEDGADEGEESDLSSVTSRLESVRLAPAPAGKKAPQAPAPGADPLSPQPQSTLSPNAAIDLKDRERRGSGAASARSSVEKIRASLDFKRKSPDGDKQQQSSSQRLAAADAHRAEKRLPPTPTSDPASATHSHTRKRKNRKRRQQEALVPPETKHLDELRPLFVEVVSPVWFMERKSLCARYDPC